jgi:hypothetical protein
MIRYSNGPIVDLTFTMDGTKAQIVSQILAALTSAGWSTVSTGIMQSATTPAGQKMRLEVRTAPENYAGVRLRNATTAGREFFIAPITGRVSRIWANKYQIFFFASGPGWPADGSCFAATVPWIPDFVAQVLTDSYVGWLQGDANRNASGTIVLESSRFYFRGLFPHWGNQGAFMWDNYIVGEFPIDGSTFTYIIFQVGYSSPSTTDQTCFWEDGTIAVWEPIICWNAGHNSSNSSSPLRHGVLWDSLIWPRALYSEIVKTIFGRRWRNVTHLSDGSLGGNTCAGGLLLLTP